MIARLPGSDGGDASFRRTIYGAVCLIVIASAAVTGCSAGAKKKSAAQVVDPTITSKLDISAEAPVQFGRLKSTLGVTPEFRNLLGSGDRKVENVTIAEWFVGEEPLVRAYFVTPVNEASEPFTIVVGPQFKGTVAGFRIGDSFPFDKWNEMVTSDCSKALQVYGAGREFRGEMGFRFGTNPLCNPLPGMPPKIPPWATYQLGLSTCKESRVQPTAGGGWTCEDSSSGIQALMLDNFHTRVVEVGKKLQMNTEPYADLLGFLFQRVSPPPQAGVDAFFGFFDDTELPGVEAIASNSRLRQAVGLYMNSHCSMFLAYHVDASRDFREVSRGLRTLLADEPWRSDTSSKLHESTELLKSYVDETAAASATLLKACRSMDSVNYQTASGHSHKARLAARSLVVLLRQQGVTTIKVPW